MPSDTAIIRTYLDALTGLSAEQLRQEREEELRQVEQELKNEDLDVLARLLLVQRSLDLAAQPDTKPTKKMEDDFVRVAQRFAGQRGISYEAFRDIGVPASLLKRAEISRGRSSIPANVVIVEEEPVSAGTRYGFRASMLEDDEFLLRVAKAFVEIGGIPKVGVEMGIGAYGAKSARDMLLEKGWIRIVGEARRGEYELAGQAAKRLAKAK